MSSIIFSPNESISYGVSTTLEDTTTPLKSFEENNSKLAKKMTIMLELNYMKFTPEGFKLTDDGIKWAMNQFAQGSNSTSSAEEKYWLNQLCSGVKGGVEQSEKFTENTTISDCGEDGVNVYDTKFNKKAEGDFDI